MRALKIVLLLYALLHFCLSGCDAFAFKPNRRVLRNKIVLVPVTATAYRFKPFPARVSSLRSIISTNIPEPPVIRYLEKDLQLSDDVLRKIILRFPWILYLQVATNLKPTIEVFHAFGFKVCEIRNIVSHAPSVLAINYQWTLPEKLISIQKMFHLNQEGLVRVVVRQPYLLTSSIERNYRTANFLSNVAQFTEVEVQRLVTSDPRITMCSVSVLQRCWSVLTKLYGIPAAEARALILRYPLLFSSKLMKNIKERLIVFSSELQVESFPSAFVQALAHRFPPILYIDTVVFMKPNLDILNELLSTKFVGAEALGSVKYKRIYELLRPVRSEDQHIASRFNRTELVQAARHLLEDSVHHNVVLLVKTFPQLLAYNPVKLRLMCANAVHFLTGERLLDFASSVILPADTCTQQSHDCDLAVLDAAAGDEDQPYLAHIEHPLTVDTNLFGAPDGTSKAADNVEEGDVAESVDSVEEWYHSSARDQSLEQLDLIAGIALPFIRTETSAIHEHICAIPEGSASSHSQALLVYARQGGSLSLDTTRAVHILRTSPWILSYRIMRSQRVLAALAVSLGMTNAELSKCVGTYPRLLSLSIDGKLSAVLRTVATFAATHLVRQSLRKEALLPVTSCNTIENQSVAQDLLHAARQDCANTPSNLTQAIAAHRADAVRTLAREIIMRYPLILGTSLQRVQQRFASAAAAGLCWDDYLKLLRWPEARHAAFQRTWQHKVPFSQSSSSAAFITRDDGGVPADLCDIGLNCPAQPSMVEGAPPSYTLETAARNTTSLLSAASVEKVRPPVRRSTRPSGTVKNSTGANQDTILVSAKDARIFEPYPDALKLRSMFANQRRSVQRSAFKVLKDMLPF